MHPGTRPACIYAAASISACGPPLISAAPLGKQTAAMVPLWATLAVAGFALKEVSIGDQNVALMTADTRLGRAPGRAFPFLLNFGAGANSTVHVSNAAYSTEWKAAPPSDVVSSRSLALRGTFVEATVVRSGPLAIGDVATLAFDDFVGPAGAHVCNMEVDVGRLPPGCLGKSHEVACAADGCWLRVDIAGSPGAHAKLQDTVRAPRCEVPARLGSRDVCVEPAGWQRRDGKEQLVYALGLGSANPRVSWWRGPGAVGELHVRPAPEEPVEAAGMVALLTVGFVLWCDYTSGVTRFAATAAGGTADEKLVHHITATTGIGPIFFADLVFTVAIAVTLAAWHHGVAVLHEAALFSPDYAEALVVFGVAINWIGTAAATVVLCVIPRLHTAPHQRRRAAGLLLARASLEAACLVGIHQLLPNEQLFQFVDIIGLFFGLVIMVVVSRDLFLGLQLQYWPAVAALAALWALVYQYACFALILPAVDMSSAVYSARHTAVVYAATLGGQAAAAGVLDALRKLGRI